jgi:sec-independent protein translocase protein TatC
MLELFRSKEPDGGDMSFWEHVDQLRPRLLRSVVAFVLFMLLAFLFGDELMMLITGPKAEWFPTNRLFAWFAETSGKDFLRINTESLTLINTAMAGQFNLHIRLAFNTALILVIPYALWELWGFIRPALTSEEQRKSRFFVFEVSLCFFVGALFGYFALAPLSVNFLGSYSMGDQLTNMIDVSSYLSLVLNMVFACGVIFLLPILSRILAKMGILTADFMRKYRRHAIVVLAILSAFITPPDVASMMLVLAPLYGLYELSIYIVARTEKIMEG